MNGARTDPCDVASRVLLAGAVAVTTALAAGAVAAGLQSESAPRLAGVGGMKAGPTMLSLIAAAWQAAWLVAALTGRARGAGRLCWTASLLCASRGESGWTGALFLLAVPWLLARALSPQPVLRWAERCARLRRARSEITLQLELSGGWVPWARSIWQVLLWGTDAATGADPAAVNEKDKAHLRHLAELDDAAAALDERFQMLLRK